MRSEDRADEGRALLEGEEPAPAHPFVEVREHRAVRGIGQRLAGRLNDLPAGGAEHDRLHVIPAAGNGIHAVAVPQLEEKLPLIVAVPEVHQNDLRPSRNGPAPETAGQIALGGDFAQGFPAGFVRFLKFGVVPEIGAEQVIILAVMLHGFKGLAADDGVNAAHLVADFPAYFKESRMSLIMLHEDSFSRRPEWPARNAPAGGRPQTPGAATALSDCPTGSAASSVSSKSAITFI